MALNMLRAPTMLALNRRPTMVVMATAAKPKLITRAPSAYNLYVKSTYSKVSDELRAKGNAKPSLADCTAIVRDRWTKLPEREKQQFQAESEKIKESTADAR